MIKKVKQHKFLFIISTLILTMLLQPNSYASSWSLFKERLPTTPVGLPIDISKKGNKSEIDLRVETKEEKEDLEPESTAFELQFIPYDPRYDKNSKHYEGFFRRNFYDIGMLRKYFRKHTRDEWAEIRRDSNRVVKLLGGSVPNNLGSPSAGEYPSDYVQYKAVPLPDIQLTIISLDDVNKKVVYDKVLKIIKHPEIGGYYHKYLEDINLKPGKYRVIAESQSNSLEFKGVKIFLVIGSYRSKV